jgi:hypothetical protein
MPTPASRTVRVFFFLFTSTRIVVSPSSSLKFTHRSQGSQFLRGIYGVGDQFPEEYFVIGIEEFFDDGENVLSGNIDGTFLSSLKSFNDLHPVTHVTNDMPIAEY